MQEENQHTTNTDDNTAQGSHLPPTQGLGRPDKHSLNPPPPDANP